jgi:O-methyltransferase
MLKLSTSLSRFKNSILARLLHPMVRKVRARGLTYLSNARLISLARHVDAIIASQPEPVLMEFGVALGGSAILMTHALNHAGKGLFLGYDMFGMIPAPSQSDEEDARMRYAEIAAGRSLGIKGKGYYGYEPDLLSKVRSSFSEFGLQQDDRYRLIAGDFRETFVSPPSQIDLMHIDCDWHDSVVFCLEAARKYLREGGYIIVDDYNDYKGCKTAVDAFVSRHAAEFSLIADQPHAVIRRIA